MLSKIYNSIDLEEFNPDPEIRKHIRSDLHFTDEHIVIGFVGRMELIKGVDVLLDALIPLMQINPRYRAIFVGDGSILASLQKRTQEAGVNDAVRFLGFRMDVAEVLNAIDIGCMPSRFESFGLAAIER
jgi:glycosyltransferase involved in cell wall biosynthesis